MFAPVYLSWCLVSGADSSKPAAPIRDKRRSSVTPNRPNQHRNFQDTEFYQVFNTGAVLAFI